MKSERHVRNARSEAKLGESFLGTLGRVPGADIEQDSDETLRIASVAEFNGSLPEILARLFDDDGRWILIAEVGDWYYLQFLATEEDEEGKILFAECVSNESITGALSVEQEETLPLLGWEWPEPPGKPNWSYLGDGPESVPAVADLAARTMRWVFGCDEGDEVLVKLFRSSQPIAPKVAWQGIARNDIRAWKRAGFDGLSAAHWRLARFSPKEARAMVAAGATTDDAMAWLRRGWGAEVVADLVDSSNISQFRSGRWNDLLGYGEQAWRLAWVCKSGVPLEEIELYVAAGLDPAFIGATAAAGGTPDQVRRLVDAGISSSAVPVAVRLQLSPREARKWTLLKLDEQTLWELLEGGASVQQVSRLVSLGATSTQILGLPLSQMSQAQADGWIKSGVRHCVREYLDIGIEVPAVARQWEENGFAPTLIQGFLDAGLTPAQARLRVQAGLTDADVRLGLVTAPLSGTPWSRVFRRSRATEYDFALLSSPHPPPRVRSRFWYAVESLTAAAEYGSGTSCSGFGKFFFADGVVCGDKRFLYSPSYAYVRGTNTLRLICARMGLTQPHRLKGEAALPNLQELEADLLRPRRPQE
jgi:hypothetical protein